MRFSDLRNLEQAIAQQRRRVKKAERNLDAAYEELDRLVKEKANAHHQSTGTSPAQDAEEAL